MKTKLSINTLICHATLFLSALAFLDTNSSIARAQGTAFTYQGRLNDGSSPANGIYDLRFTIYDSASGGSALAGSLTNSPTGVTNGLFTVTLDFGNPFPGADRWLEIGVRTNGDGAFTALSPRQKITSTPYAIQSANAASALSVSGSVAAAQLTGTISSNNIANGSISSTLLAAGAVTTSALADGAVTAAKVATVTVPLFLTTFTNPALVAGDWFGVSVAAVGNDRVLIGAINVGASYGGAAYLFSTNGTLLTTFTNSTPEVRDFFGYSVTAVGSDRVLIGAFLDDSEAGAAYLFSTNGTLLTTYTNPLVAGNWFGVSVAAVGKDLVLIGAVGAGASYGGAAYLFSTNGTLLTTFTNPTPEVSDFFGWSVTAVGSDRVLIGAPYDDTGAFDAGAAYLFSTNGTFLTAFTNPTPEANDQFGWFVAAVGSARVLIGAFGDDTGASDAGAAYLFSTNGELLTTFTNPTPAFGDNFGYSVAAVGTDRVLIGAHYDDTGAFNAGAAYLFSTNGTLITTFINPTPEASDDFGTSVAGVGTDRVLIGVRKDDTGADDVGAAYLFSLETYTPGLVADGVSSSSITTASLENGAVTPAKLDPTIGVWTRSGDNVHRLAGNVGIGTTTPGFTLEVNGTAGKPGGGSWSVASDERLKKNIRPLAGALDKLLALHGVNFEYIDPAKIHELSGERMGLLAQEVEKVFPDWVETGADGYKRVTVRGLEALVVEALRELRTEQATRLAEELKRRDAENAELRQRLEALERLLDNKLNGDGKRRATTE